MKRLLTFLFLLLGFVLLNKQVRAQNPSTGDAFMNLPDTTCWKSFASTNAFFWKSHGTDSVDWTITGGAYNILYSSDTYPDLSPKLTGQKPEPAYNRNALTIQFLSKGQYTIKAVLYYNGVKTTVTKLIYSQDCSMLPCLGQNTGVGDFLEDFGRFRVNATNSVSSPNVPAGAAGYTYVPVPVGSGGFPDNSYTVFWHSQMRSEWIRTLNHTPNTDPAYVGGMLVANSSSAKKTFFVKKNVPVCPGSLYNFSAWFINLNSLATFNSGCASGNADGYHYAGVTFQITDDATGTVLAKFKTYDVSMNLDGPTWQEYGGGFKTPANVTSVTLSISNDRLGDCGNDIAIDDISFKYCSPYIYSFIDGKDKPPLRMDSLCEGAPVTIKAVYAPINYFADPVYQWQYTKDTLNWTGTPFPAGVTGINTSVLTFPPGTLKGDPNVITDYYFRVNILERNNPSNCASPSLYTKITVLPKPKVTISSGRICIGDSVLLTANGGYSAYEWQTTPIVTGPQMTAYPLVNTTYAAIGIADYGWNSATNSPRQCRDTGYAKVIVDLKPTVKLTANPLDICLGNQINLTQVHGVAPEDSISWRWQYNGTNIGNLNDPSLVHTPADTGTKKYKITVTNHTCNTSDSAFVNVRSVPTADNDTIIRQCNIPNFNITRTTPPADQQGKWIFDGPHKLEVITNTTNPATSVTGVLPGDTVRLAWVVTNKSLAACTDTSRVTLINTKPLTPSNAGTDMIQCDTTIFRLNATQPGNGEKGKWTLAAGTTAADVTLNYDTAYNATATILGAARPKTVKLIWSITNGVCAGPNSDTISLTVKNSPTVNITAAPICNSPVDSFTVSYNSKTGNISDYVLDVLPTAPAARKMPGFTQITGTWPSANVTGLFKVKLPAGTPAGNYDFVVTVKEGTLTGCSKTIRFSLSVELPSTDPTKVTASVDSICVSGSTTLTVVGGSLGTDSTGKKATWKWYTGACPGSPGSKRVYPASSNADSSIVTFNNITDSTTFYVRAEGTSVCGSTACVSVKVRVFTKPNVANANLDQKACERTSDFVLAGNATGIPGVNGLWTTTNPRAVITNPTLPNATVKVNIGDTATLVWTIANGPCLITRDTMFITNYKQPVAAAANVDQLHCNDSIFTMAANKPTEYGAYGAWTVVGKPTWATITDTTLNTTKVKVLAGHTATLVWTITNGTCAATTDTVLLTNYAVPNKAAAGPDQVHCNDSIFTMAANPVTQYGAYGYWKALNNPAGVTITNDSLYNTTVKVLAGRTATMIWTTGNGTCAATTDTVLLTNYAVPNKAAAGPDQVHCNDSIFTMAANPVTQYGAYGYWKALNNPAGVTITNDSLYNTTVRVLAGRTATMIWTTGNGTCAATTDTVLLTNYAVPNKAAAGPDQVHCNDSIFTMAANPVTQYGAYGYWKALNNPAGVTITNDSLYNTTVKVLAGRTATMIWTTGNGTCAATTDTVLLTNYAVPNKAAAGPDQVHCNDSIFTMAANKVTQYGAYGYWKALNNPAGVTITNDSLFNTTVKVLAGRTATMIWTTGNGTCAATTDTVLLTNYAVPNKAAAGPDQVHCNDSIFTMAANPVTQYGAYGYWKALNNPAGVTITNDSLYNTTVKVLAGRTATMIWTTGNGTCAATTDTVLLTNYAVPNKAAAGPDQVHCNDSIFTMAANPVTQYGAYGYWKALNNPAGVTITNDSLFNTTVKVLAGRTATMIWTTGNGTCAATTDTVLLTNYAVPNKAAAGPDQVHCNDSIFTMAANPVTQYGAYGYWKALNNPAGVTITNDSLYNTTVKVLAGRTAIMIWTTGNGTCAATTDTVLLTNYAVPNKAAAGPDQVHCNDSIFTMAANPVTQYGAYGYWKALNNPAGVTITNDSLYNTTVKVLAGRTATMIWTTGNGTCAATTDTVLLTNYAVPNKAAAGPDQVHCNDSIFTMAANPVTQYGAYGYWKALNNPAGVTITKDSLYNTTVKVLAGRTATMIWTTGNGTCAATTDTVLLTNYAVPNKAAAGPDQVHCNDSIFTMAANPVTQYGAYGYWKALNNPAGVTITKDSLFNTTVKVLAGRTATMIWTTGNGTCAATTDTVLLTNYAVPNKAAAGPDQVHCNDSIFTMAANPVTQYGAYGYWKALNNPAGVTITNDSLYNTTVKVLAGRTATMIWTTGNGTCAATTDTVLLTNYAVPNKAAAGPDQVHCNDSIFTMAANPVTQYGAYGYWKALNNPAGVTITNDSLYNTTVKVLAGRTATMIWTTGNGTCAATTDTVLLTNYAVPNKAVAGPNQVHCNDSIFTMAANPVTQYGAYGYWKALNNPAGVTITNDSLYNTTVKVLAGRTATMIWTTGNGTCAATTDTVLLTNYAVPNKAAAGPDQVHCNDSIFTMAANPVTQYGAYGYWKALNNPAGVTITNDSLYNTTVKVLAGRTATMIWTTGNGTCAATTDTVLLTNYAVPNKAAAGPDQVHCNDSIFTMAANPVTQYGAYGYWKALNNPAGVTITNDSLYNTTVKVLAGRTATMIWTTGNGTCAATTDTVLLTNYAVPNKAAAGPDQVHCNDSIFTMAANPVTQYGAYGYWKALNNPAGVTITNDSLYNTTVKVLAGRTATMIWTTGNGTCAATTDTVLLTNYAVPNKAAAGPDQVHCNDSIFTMAANPVTQYGAYGYWKALNNPAGVNITNDSLYNTTVKVLAGRTATMIWTTGNGTCAATTDTVLLTNYAVPNKAAAGPDQVHCNDSIFTMAANPVTQYGAYGYWKALNNPAGVTITNDSLYNTTVKVLAGRTATMIWTTGNGTCAATTDTVLLTNYAVPNKAAAGPDQVHCNDSIFTMAANPVTQYGAYGYWKALNNPAGVTITNDSLFNTTVKVLAGRTATMIWTTGNGTCAATTDTVLLTNYAVPNKAAAGPDQVHCNDSIFTMAANPVTQYGAYGYWKALNNPAGVTITNDSLYNTTVKVLAGRTATMIWTTGNGTCAATTDTVLLTNYAVPNKAAAGPNQVHCNDSIFTMAANPVTQYGAYGYWKALNNPAGVTITNDSLFNTTVKVLAGRTATLVWTITNGTCAATTDTVLLTNYAVPNKAAAGPDQVHCNDSIFTMAANPVTQYGAYGYWKALNNPAGVTITNDSLFNTTVKVLAGRTATMIWTTGNGTCAATTDTVLLTNYAVPNKAVAGPNQVHCNDSIFTMAANPVTQYGAYGYWKALNNPAGVTITNDSLYNTTVKVLAGRTATLVWTITNGTCAATTDTVLLTNYAVPNKAAAGPDQVHCNDSIFTMAANPVTQYGAYGYWKALNNPAGVTITNDSLFNTTVKVLAGRTATMIWTTGNGTCAATTDTVLLTNYAVPNKAAAGPDQVHCNDSIFTMAANPVTQYGAYGYWKALNNPAGVTITNDSLYNTTVKVLAGRTATMIWTTGNGTCAATTDTVLLTNYAVPNKAAAGPDQVHCNDSIFTMAANPVTQYGAYGYWKALNNPAGVTITNDSLYNTTVKVLAGRTATMIWTTGNGTCAATTDTVLLTNYAVPNKAAAGPDQVHCNDSIFTMAANPVTQYGAYGYWKALNNPAGVTITNDSLYNTTVKVLAGRTATMIWTTGNGTCAATTDTVLLTNYAVPNKAAAGPDQVHCNDSIFTMAANPVTQYGAYGYWKALNNPAGVTITNDSLYNTTVKVLAGRTATMIWTTGNGTCAATTDTVLLTNYAVPNKAAAGPDQVHCNDSIFTMAANPVTQYGAYGYWKALNNPAGVTITNDSLFNTTVKVLAGRTATLVWTITNGTCAATTDTVLLTNYAVPNKAAAGPDQLHCNDSIFTMAANKVTQYGAYGYWKALNNPAGVTITNDSLFNTTVKVLAGRTATLVWTITNGTCAATTDTVLLTNYDVPAIAKAGADQKHCNDSIFNMAANRPTEYGAKGTWSVVGKPTWATITDTTLNTTKVKVLAGHTATLVWTISNGTCAATTDTVLLTNYDVPAVAKANVDQLHCNDSIFTMAANKPTEFGAYGRWSVIGKPTWVAVVDTTLNTTKVKVLAGHTATLVWTISNGTCAATTDTVLLTNYDVPAIAKAGADQKHCNDSIFNMAANRPTEYGAKGTWSVVGKPTWATITDTTLNTTRVRVLAGHTATLVWTITNGTCAATTDTVLLTNYDVPAVAKANVDQLHCNDSIFTMAANRPTEYGAKGTWSVIGKPTWVTVTDTTLNTTKVKVLAGHTATLVWTISNGTCATTTDTVLLTNYDIPAVAKAGADQKHCNDSIFTMAANKPTEFGAYGRWSVVGKPTWVAVADTTLNITKVKVLAGHTATLVWTISNGTCAATSDTVLLTNYDVPAIAKAGADQKHCNDSIFNMAANKPTEYGAKGTWSVVGKPTWATITDTTLNTTKVKVLAGHTATLVWTISNGTCAATTDTVLLTNYDVPAVAKANVDQLHCNDSIFTMAANKPTEFGTYGRWSVIGKPTWVVVVDTTLSTTKVKVLAGHTATLVWTISNGTCAATTDTVLLTNYDVPAIAKAGADQKHCNDSIFNMAANRPTEYGAKGTWSVVGKPTWATITDTTLNTTRVRVLAGHTATLVWTITNGTCAATTDTVLLTNYDVPAVAKANVDQLHCNDSIFTMAANRPTEYGAKGTWSVIGKPTWVTVTDTTLNTTNVKVLAGHTATLVWTISNGTCAATTDTVLLTNYDVPAIAKANVDQLHCNDSIFTMAANKPTEFGAYGRWSVVGKPTWVAVADTTLNITKVKVLAGHTATLVWTISNGTCAATSDTVLLTNYDVPAIAKAGADQKHCNDSIFNMAANKPTEYGAKGTWSVIGKPTWATITDTTLNTTKVKVLAGHTATLVWTISNGTCAATTDTVLLTNYDVPAVAKANVDQLHCNDSIFTMAANKPTEYGAYGRWSVIGKPTWVAVVDTTLNTTKVKVLAGHTATLVWTISNGTCAATTDTVLLTNYDVPAIAKAGADQKHCNDSIFNMAANRPTEYGAKGTWSVVGKPTWATITDTTLNTTRVRVLAGHTATLVWTITNGTCAATTDTVLLTNYDVPAVAKANVDQLHCNDSIFTMAANRPTEYGAKGTWSVIGKPTWVTVTDTTLNTTNVKVLAGHTATLVWTISNGTCAATTDTVLLTNYDIPAVAKAGADQKHCNDSIFNMAANRPTEYGAKGTWSVVGKPTWATITDTTLNTTRVRVLAGHTATLVWTITNGTCAATTDTVLLTNYAIPAVAKAGADQKHCNDSIFTMAANQPTEYGAKGTWTVIGKPTWATITDSTLNTTTVKVLAGHTATLLWTISNGTCAATIDTVLLTNFAVPAVAKAGADQKHCNDSIFTMAANQPAEYGAKGTWSVIGKPTWVAVADTTLSTTKVKVLAGHTATLVWTITNGTCAATTDTVLLTNYDIPAVAKAGPDQKHCNDSIFTMAANKPTEYGAYGTWSAVNKPSWVKITDSTLHTTQIKVLAGHTATLVWTITNGTCAATTDTVLLTNYDVPAVAKAGPDQKHCNDSIFNMAANQPTEYGTKGVWSAVNKPSWVKITDSTLSTTQIKVLAGHTATLVWTISNGTCAATTDTVLLTNYDVPAVAKAGPDQKHCNDSIFNMAANQPTEYGAKGVWSVVNKPSWVKITDSTSNTTQVKVLAGHTAIMVWTISNGTCAATTDTVLLTNYAIPAVAKAGADQKHCNDSIFTMAANKPAEYGAYGVWTAVGKPTWVTITNDSLNTTSVKVLAGHTATLIWTIGNGTCAATIDTVFLTNYAVPAIAKAGADQEHCNDSIFTMAANKPTEYGAYGVWEKVGNPGWVIIANDSLSTTKVTVLAGHTATLVWKIGNGTCATTADTVLLTNYANANQANAGPDQRICNNTGDFIMAANAPGVPTAKGTWTDISPVPGKAIIKSPNSPTTAVTVPIGDTVILQWAIANGVCDTTFSRVTIINYKAAITANAGPDQEKCNTTADFIMKGSQPGSSSAKGVWEDISRIPGAAVIKSPNDPFTSVTVPIGDTVILKWTVTNGTCTSSSSIVTLINYKKADDANAGADIEMCNNTGDFTMAATPPSVPSARGFWSIIKGNAVIKSINSPTAAVNVNVGDTVTLRWTVTNGVCSATWDDVTLINYQLPVAANAGPDQEHCDDATFKMNASDPGVAGAKGTWIVTSNNAALINISNINQKDATITVPAGETAQLTWVVSNGVCDASSSSVTLINRKPILGNTIQADQTVCITEMPMALRGIALTGGNGTYTYQWQQSTTGATGPFTNINGANSDIYQPGTLTANTWYRRIVASGACINNISNAVKITVVTIRPIVTFTPAAITTECEKGKDYTTLFGEPVFSHAPYDNETLTVTHNDVTVVTSPCLSTITRTWTATDRCGLSVSASQTITIKDTKAPVFTTPAPADITVDCDKVPAKTDLKANDDCAGEIIIPVVEVRQDIPGSCANSYLLIRTWTAKDECNTGITLKQIITVKDMTAPVFNIATPADTTVDCDKVPAGFNLTASDNCTPGVITVIPKDSIVHNQANCNNNYLIYRKWTAFDECGNASAVQQIIKVQDTTKPVFSMPAPKDTVVDCDKVPAWPVITATDNCTATVQVFTSTKTVKLPGNCAGNYQETRTWTVTDDCGNKSTMQQIITVQDTTKPVFTVKPPADTTVSCDNIPDPAIDVQVTDNCSTIGNGLTVSRRVTTERTPGDCAGNYRIIRTWIAKDACGNTTTMTQVVTVKDTTRPVIMPAPADVVIFCQDKIPAPPVLTATDNCDNTFPKKAIYTEDPFVADICNGYTIVRRWTIMDACGNKANDVIQRVIINPCPKPQLEATLPSNCSDNGRIALRKVGDVYLPTYTLVSVTPSNVVTGLPLTQSNNVFNLNGATSASFIITDGRTGCSSDTMTYNLTYIQTPMVNLGNDTTICGGNSLVLDAGPANFAYQIKWSTGATTQRININQAGTYWVNVSNGECATTDTIHVGLVPTPLVDIPDTTICRGQSVKLDAYVNGAQYLWSNGSTASSILVGTQEQFWVKVMKSGCITIDTVKVSVNPPPDISLSRDTTICPDQSIMLTVNSNGGRIQWQTGETGNSIVVNQPGGYWVAVSRDNCVVRDTVNVRLKPTITLDLGPDRNICPGGSITLDGTNPDAISYLWNDGDPNPVKQITQAGKYKLAVMDRFCQRVFMDSVKVNITGLPVINLGRDTVMCKGETLILRAEGGGITGVRWDNGSSAPSLTVTNGGTYTVTVFNDCGSATDAITVDFVQCEPKPTVPNAFSPNGDGRNDVFRPVVRGQMFDYELRIFNRWGELIFMTSDNHKGWDGKYKGVPVDIGTYVWWLNYKKVAGGTSNVLKGEVTVVR